MNPISSGSQTPKRRWQEPQLLSQQWPGKKGGGGGRQGSGDEERWLLPRSPPQFGGRGAACQARGEGGPRAARIPCERRPPPPARSQPSASRCGQTGRGRGGAPRRAPRVPGSRPRRRVRRPGARSARGAPRSPAFLPPRAARGLSGPPLPFAPFPGDSRPGREAALSQRHPHPHPSHDLKRRKWCPAPRRPPQTPQPRDSLQPLTPSSPSPGPLPQGPQTRNPRALPSLTPRPLPSPALTFPRPPRAQRGGLLFLPEHQLKFQLLILAARCPHGSGQSPQSQSGWEGARKRLRSLHPRLPPAPSLRRPLLLRRCRLPPDAP